MSKKEKIKENNKNFKNANYKNLNIQNKKYNDYFNKFINKPLLLILKAFLVYLLWIFLHYFAAHLYIHFCVPNTTIGFLMSPIMIKTPHCQGLRWIVYNAAEVVNNMWVLIGSWIYSVIWIFK